MTPEQAIDKLQRIEELEGQLEAPAEEILKTVLGLVNRYESTFEEIVDCLDRHTEKE